MIDTILTLLFGSWILLWVIPVVVYHVSNLPVGRLPWVRTWECWNCNRRHIDFRGLEQNDCSNCDELNWTNACKEGEIPS